MQFHSFPISKIVYLIFLGSVCQGAPVVLHYDPAVVQLEGVLELQNFPGPPNYQSIAKGDQLERHFYLKLDKEVAVIASEKDQAPDTKDEKNVKVVQLSIDGEDRILWSRFRKLGEGTHVRIVGKLMHQFTGHHHSRVVLLVDQIKD
jgi:hypothetical protein